MVLSTPLLYEYEHVVRGNQAELGLSDADIEVLLDGLCRVSEHQKVYFLWRPCLPDAKDDHVLELAVAAGVDCIVTHNTRHFEPAGQFGVKVRTPRQIMESRI